MLIFLCKGCSQRFKDNFYQSKISQRPSATFGSSPAIWSHMRSPQQPIKVLKLGGPEKSPASALLPLFPLASNCPWSSTVASHFLDPHLLLYITEASVFDGIGVSIPFCLCVFEIICDLCVFVFYPLTLFYYLSLNCVCLLLQSRISPFTCSFLA